MSVINKVIVKGVPYDIQDAETARLLNELREGAEAEHESRLEAEQELRYAIATNRAERIKADETITAELEKKVEASDTALEVDSIEETLVTNALRKTAQILTDAEKQQVQKNIGVDVIQQQLQGNISTVQQAQSQSATSLRMAITDEANRATAAEKALGNRIDNIQPVEFTGTVVNAPDEEDITELDNALKLKDRPWGDGMGYVILRKNKPLHEQLIEENTIYEVRYDFDLNGEEITMPANCVLKFEGGSLSNGKIVGTDSKIDSIPYHIFKKNFSLSSLWNIDVVFPEWFGAKGDGITDDTDAFILSINRVGGTVGTLKLMPNREYIVTRPIAFWGTKFTIDGSNSIIIKNTDTKSGLDDYQTSLAGTVSIDVNSVFISRAPIQEMCITNLRIRNTGEEGYCFYFPEISKSKIEKVTVTDSTYFFASYDCWEFLFSHIEGYKLKKKFIHLRATGTSITCINCHLDNMPFAQTGELAAAFDFTSIAYVTLIGCAADACANLIRLNDTKANLISCGFEGTKQQALYITNRSIVTISALHCYESWPQKAAPMIEVHNSNIYIQGSGFKILNECYGTKIAAVNSIVKVTNTIIKNDEDLIPVSDWVLQTASGGTIYIDDDERTYYIKDAGVTAVKGILAESQYAVSTANRPIANAKSIGLCVYDDDLKKPIWWTGSKWQDALGNEV